VRICEHDRWRTRGVREMLTEMVCSWRERQSNELARIYQLLLGARHLERPDARPVTNHTNISLWPLINQSVSPGLQTACLWL